MRKFLWILLILLIIALIFWWLCREHKLWFCKTSDVPASWRTYISVDSTYKHIPADSTEQIIVWRTPGSHDGYLNFWLDSILKAEHLPKDNLKITLFCSHCDSSLMLLTGKGIKTFIQSGGGGKGGGTTCTNPPTAGCSGGGPGGGGDTLYWCINYPVEFNDSLNSDNIDSLPPIQIQRQKEFIPHLKIPLSPVNNSSGNDITVAVFDTGVDTLELKNYLYKNSTPSCLSSLANNGWNFPGNTNIVQDDYHSRVGHGQVVARLITDQVNHYHKDNIKVLPVKIHNSKGESDLFSVLCGFAYAKERNAQIINASFGYYAVKNQSSSQLVDPGAVLLKAYIKYYLTNNNILLIAAAGNATPGNDSVLQNLYKEAGLPLPTNFRNLDEINFYPASLAADPELVNVISVTTVNKSFNNVSPNENFSKSVVDIGVTCNLELDNDDWFMNPRITNSYVRGSSYATPVVTGIICAFYDEIKSNTGTTSNKNKILNFLLGNPQLGNTNNVGGKVRSGVIFENAH